MAEKPAETLRRLALNAKVELEKRGGWRSTACVALRDFCKDPDKILLALAAQPPAPSGARNELAQARAAIREAAAMLLRLADARPDRRRGEWLHSDVVQAALNDAPPSAPRGAGDVMGPSRGAPK